MENHELEPAFRHVAQCVLATRKPRERLLCGFCLCGRTELFAVSRVDVFGAELTFVILEVMSVASG